MSATMHKPDAPTLSQRLKDTTALEAKHEAVIMEALEERHQAEAALDEAMEKLVRAMKSAKQEGVSVPQIAQWLEVTRDGAYKLMSRYE